MNGNKTLFFLSFPCIILLGHLLTKVQRPYIGCLVFSLPYYLNIYQWVHVSIRRFNSMRPEFNFIFDIYYYLLQNSQFFLISFILIYARKFKFQKTFVVSVLLTTVEIVTPDLLPAHPGYIFQSASWLNGWSSYGSVYFYSFICYFLICSFFYTKDSSVKVRTFLITIVFLLLSGLAPSTKRVESEPIVVRAVQSGVIDYFKYKDFKKNHQYLTSHFLELNKKLSVGPSPDLYIYGEAVYQYDDLVLGTKSVFIPNLLKTILQDKDSVLFGVLLKEEFNSRDYRSGVAVYYNEGNYQQKIYKKKLVPFSEDFLFDDLQDFVNEHLDTPFLTSYPMESDNILKLKKDYNAGVLLCWEVVFPFFLRSTFEDKKVDILLNIANESFFDGTNEMALHSFLAKYRELEFNIPLLKVTRTGETFYFEDGVETNSLKDGVGSFDISIDSKTDEITFFHQYGAYAFLMMIFSFYLYFRLSLYLWKFLDHRKLVS